jgi:hypothetical protein
MNIRPVILSGGSGTRLWPLSRAAYPKQLMPLVGQESLLQETVERVSDPNLFSAPLLICNDEHRFLVAEQLRALGCKPEAIVLEPLARNTAPAVAAAAMMAAPDSLLLILPSDHYIQDAAAFRSAVRQAAKAAEADRWSPSASRPARRRRAMAISGAARRCRMRRAAARWRPSSRSRMRRRPRAISPRANISGTAACSSSAPIASCRRARPSGSRR